MVSMMALASCGANTDSFDLTICRLTYIASLQPDYKSPLNSQERICSPLCKRRGAGGEVLKILFLVLLLLDAARRALLHNMRQFMRQKLLPTGRRRIIFTLAEENIAARREGSCAQLFVQAVGF